MLLLSLCRCVVVWLFGCVVVLMFCCADRLLLCYFVFFFFFVYVVRLRVRCVASVFICYVEMLRFCWFAVLLCCCGGVCRVVVMLV